MCFIHINQSENWSCFVCLFDAEIISQHTITLLFRLLSKELRESL